MDTEFKVQKVKERTRFSIHITRDLESVLRYMKLRGKKLLRLRQACLDKSLKMRWILGELCAFKFVCKYIMHFTIMEYKIKKKKKAYRNSRIQCILILQRTYIDLILK